MAKAYYGSRISENMTRTPEGFLICHNVPIARVGWQEYSDIEVGLPGACGKMINVYRGEDEVFNAAAIASFELKSATDDHAPEEVVPDNYAAYEKGQATNVRRGSGEQSDLLIADLIIKDPNLISKIENGKREISCGYDCLYVPIEGGYAQVNIRGNHVAVVQAGRAGHRVAIKDEKPKEERRKSMSKVTDKILRAIGWKQFVMDASPEEVAEALENEKKSDPAPEPEKKTDDEAPTWAKGIMDRLDALEQAGQKTEPEPDALDELEKEVNPDKKSDTEDEETEESVTVPADKLDEEKKPVGDAALRQSIAVARAVIAGLPETERKAATQRAADALRKGAATPADNHYKQMLNRKTNDAAVPKEDPKAFGQACAKFNPHMKK